MLILWRTLLFAGLWLIFESVISWAAFCNQGAAYEAPEKYECIFHGPVFSLARAIIYWWGHIFDKADAYVALFTGFLFVSTVALWLSTRRLWKVTEASIRATERTTLAVEGAYVFAGVGGSGPIIDLNTGFAIIDQKTGRPIIVLSASAINYGRTAGLISTIEWDICPEEKLPPIGAALIYRKRIFVDWTIAPGPRGQLHRQIKRVSILKRPHVFYGRITFTDLLRKKRGFSEFMHLVSPNGAITPVEGRDASSRTYIED
jgi:hypothetical protein